MGVFEDLSASLIAEYNSFVNGLPAHLQQVPSLILLVLLVALYAVFIWKFYRFVATKNILDLNLSQYNRSKHPFIEKIFATVLYLLEYIIILPIIIFFWFAIFTLFLIFLTENIATQRLLIISATIIGAIRITSYYSEDLSKDLAKLLPFTLLAVAILRPDFFNIPLVLGKITELTSFVSSIVIFLVFMIALESVLRFFDFIFSLFGSDEEIEEE